MPFKEVRRILVLMLAVAMLSFMLACGGDDDDDDVAEGDTATETAGTPYKSSGNEGSITGAVNFTGEAPAPKPISMDADAACAQNNPNPQTEDVVVKDGKLANVLVYIKDGKTADGKSITGFTFDVPAAEVTLDQKGCHYVPHVLALMAGQKLKVTNSDPTAHNVHPSPKSNKEWNQSQPAGAAPIIQTFTRAEVVVPVKCNQHPWMKANIGVMKHPLYAVTGENGAFEIKGVPPGTYNLATWHERYGEKTQSITIGAKETKTQDFTVDASAGKTASLGLLEVMPAIEFPVVPKH
ncbi:MAG TPA: carboxypeptidase regulatory-like domain-containing protein [Pyrinomonadaceae bacterium]|jgi:plastocyanin|nr:carboxypeptidase regulatory-like domain-containing protein [Pyrinomonadaceae bacterium]